MGCALLLHHSYPCKDFRAHVLLTNRRNFIKWKLSQWHTALCHYLKVGFFFPKDAIFSQKILANFAILERSLVTITLVFILILLHWNTTKPIPISSIFAILSGDIRRKTVLLLAVPSPQFASFKAWTAFQCPSLSSCFTFLF